MRVNHLSFASTRRTGDDRPGSHANQAVVSTCCPVAWPMLYVERREYLAAMRRVQAGVEEARVVLAKARQRIDGDRPHKRRMGGCLERPTMRRLAWRAWKW